MIRLIKESDTINALNPFSIRIKALYKAYGNSKFCGFYCDTETNSIMAKCGDVLILDGELQIDENVLLSFCQVLGINTVMCSNKFQYSFPQKSEGYILKYKEGLSPKISNKIIFNDRLREIYSLITENLDNYLNVLPFDEYYVDLSHKVRHNFAMTAVAYSDDKPCCCAIASFMCDHGAVISAVCTDKQYRGKGFATQTVCALIDKIKSKEIENIYLQIEDESLLDFYYPLGFSAVGTWQEININRG